MPIPSDVVKKIGDPAYQPAMIPASTYEGQDNDVPAIAIQNFLVTRDGVSDDIVYNMTKAMFDNLIALVAAHSAGKAHLEGERDQGHARPAASRRGEVLPRNRPAEVIAVAQDRRTG